YYSCWLAALERILTKRSFLDGKEFEIRAAQYASRPHGHDH
ncbi:MAG TPA: nitrile hydratase accessory protein, partial [Acidimicrobiaceae bacterium]|nr:nitrile hydratase accessory protein [Acidimicrobiaceae bacterium]